MKSLNSNKGITLTTLVVTIVVLLILAGVATSTGIEAIENTKHTKFVAELKIMQSYVNQWYEDCKPNNAETYSTNVSTKFSNTGAIQITDNENNSTDNISIIEKAKTTLYSANIPSANYSNFYYLSNNTLTTLGVEGVSQDVLVSVQDRKVVSYLGLKYKSAMYYTIDDQSGNGIDEVYNVEYDSSLNSGEVTFDVSQEYIGNGQARITISNIEFAGYNNKWNVRYKLDNKWYDVNNAKFDTNNINFIVTKSGTYTVALKNEGIYGTSKDENGNEAGIKVLTAPEYWEATTASDPSWYNYGGAKVNQPKLTGKMTPIKYSGDLTGETNLWANAETADQSMWVWIPRYAYKITRGYHTNTENGGTIEIVFLKGTSNTEFWDTSHNGEAITANPSEVTYTSLVIDGVTEQVQDQWLVHPAFTSHPENGGWDTELTGIWFAKFETTNTTGTTTNPILDIKPSVQSFANIDIGTQFSLAKSATFGEYSALTINSHMTKNSEWGSVTYLAQSPYGANSKILNNDYKTGYGDSTKYYTGGAITLSNVYTTNNAQSTTHNSTGIYDMNGGLTENVASYGSSTNSYLELINDNNTITNSSTKFKTAYPVNYSSLQSSNRLMGDAIWETSNYVAQGKYAWYLGYTAYTSKSFFHRGGTNDNSGAGAFMYSYNNGEASYNRRFPYVPCSLNKNETYSTN
ncbi:MAG: hypothetical protein IJJ82_03105 [Clostridia bacterium]|nr:hypothetical protein [Clostridia bacterium]